MSSSTCPSGTGKAKGREVETKASAGVLDIGSMSIAAFPEQPLRVELRSGPNRLHANGPTFLRVPGGVVEIGPLVWEGMGVSSTSLQTSLSLERSGSPAPFYQVMVQTCGREPERAARSCSSRGRCADQPGANAGASLWGRGGGYEPWVLWGF